MTLTIDHSLQNRLVTRRWLRRDLREAAVRPMVQKPGPGYWLLVVALGALVTLGVVAFVVQFVKGLSVDDYSNGAFWDVNISNFITIVGVSYGGAVVSAVLRLTGDLARATDADRRGRGGRVRAGRGRGDHPEPRPSSDGSWSSSPDRTSAPPDLGRARDRHLRGRLGRSFFTCR